MANCVKCDASISRSNKSGRCKKCYETRNNDGDNSQNDTIPSTSSDSWDLNITDAILTELPELPNQWYKEDVSKLNAGHLVRIMMGFFHPVREELNEVKGRVIDLEQGNDKMGKVMDSHGDRIEDLEKDIIEKEKELMNLKKTLFNQQLFMENLQKKDLKNNMIITGIPNSDLEVDDAIYHSDEEKIAYILSEVCEHMNASSYKIVSFPSAENRTTHVCKVIFNNFEDKMNIMKNSKRLKDNDVLKSIFLQWDEPKLTRLENQRLRKVKKDTKQEFPNDTVELRKGIIKRNNRQVDKFNLMNQIF